ncbi:hypothetical protein GCM10011323_23020 [Pontibacter amylolyticus]|uniref:Cadherin domain-containing protein n=2 Tax=Pontibacter amylolyticus TaxID=1424080 RepID=A0ABQ1W706_9BACT|nr:hypothetical protein GCM10011323_23020 [Pontibacter amylolyticus]
MLAVFSIVSNFVIAQAPVTKLWDKTLGGTGYDALYSMTTTPDGGYLLGGRSSSGLGGDKTEGSRGGEDFWVVKLNADGSKVWDKRFGGSKDDYLMSLTVASDGGYLLGGLSSSDIGGDKTGALKGAYDFWVVKIDTDGNKVWDRTYGGSGDDQLISIAPTLDGGYFLGGMSSSGIGGDKSEASRGGGDYWVMKINAVGDKIWDKTLGGASFDDFASLVTTPDGGCLLGGTSTTGIGGDKSEESKGNEDYWIVKLSANGNKEWDKTIGGGGYDKLYSLIVTPDNGYLLGGASNSASGGDKTEGSRGSEDFWVVKLDVAGTKLWDKRYGGSRGEGVSTLIATQDGGYLLSGPTTSGKGGDKTDGFGGPYDFWVVKIKSDGSKEWDKSLGGSGSDVPLSLINTTDNNYLIGGVSNSAADGDKTEDAKGDHDFWVIKLGVDAIEEPNSAPTAILLSKNHINENNAIGDIIGTLSSTDVDEEDTHTYSLVAGEGSDDNTSFTIEGNALKAAHVFDYEVKSKYSIRLQTMDSGGLKFEAIQFININDIQETVLGIEYEQNEMLIVYPVPTSDYLIVSFDKLIESITLINNTGSIALTKDVRAEQAKLDLKSLKPGVYTALIYSKDNVYTKRVLLVR